MSYVVRETGGFFGGYEVGHYAPDGDWIPHSRTRYQSDAEDQVNVLNGGNHTASREHLEHAAQLDRDRRKHESAERRAQEGAARELERQRAASAELEATNLAEAARQQRNWAQAQLDSQANWLAVQEENRRRAAEEAAEQLRLYPPQVTVVRGGSASWDGIVTFHFRNGEVVALSAAAAV